MQKYIKKCLNKMLTSCFVFRVLNRKSALRLLSFSVKKYILGKKIPGVAILALTYSCQSKCSHCSAGLYNTVSEEISIQEWKNVIDQLEELGLPRLHISGGEPLLKQGFEQIVEYAASKGMIVFFETNGYALTEEIVICLKNAGVASIDISLDSAEPAVHDNLRNLNGSFRKALKAIQLCKRHDVVHMVSTYAVRDSIYSGELIKLILFAKRIKASAVRVLPPQPSGRWLAKPDISLNIQDKEYLRSGFPFYAILDRLDLPICPIKSKYTVFIAPDGEVHPCPHLPFSFGNVRNNTIAGILDIMSEYQPFREKSICFVNNLDFRAKFIEPIFSKQEKLPVKIRDN